MRIGSIHFTEETNDFNPAVTELAVFRSLGILEGDAIVEQRSDIGQVGDCIDVANANGAEVVR